MRSDIHAVNKRK